MSVLVNLIAGLLFGFGLLLSGMVDPAKVMNFLDVLGTWDPSLAFVMAGAVTVAFLGYRLAFRRSSPLVAPAFKLPTARDLDRRLIGGAAVFGIGWGLTGFCPGPAVVSVPLLAPGTLAFVPAMIAGLVLARFLRPSAPEPAVLSASSSANSGR
jgi:uncharacterized membrane protein YedE/YeeE